MKSHEHTIPYEHEPYEPSNIPYHIAQRETESPGATPAPPPCPPCQWPEWSGPSEGVPAHMDRVSGCVETKR